MTEIETNLFFGNIVFSTPHQV